MTNFERYGARVELEDISKKYPFIYDVNGDYYVIGACVFEPYYGKNGILYYQQYREAINKIGRENIYKGHYDLNHDVKILVYNYRKVMVYADKADDELRTEAKRELIEFLESVDTQTKRSLTEQLEDYVNVFWFYSRRMIY